MRALVVDGPGAVRIADVPRPRAHGWPVVSIEEAGLCGTDRKIVDGDIPVRYPLVLGHEMVGRVVEAGGRGNVAVGTRVLVDPASSCGRCGLCRRFLGHLCGHGQLMGRDVDGGLAELVSVPEERLYPIPEDLSAAGAGILQVLGTCVHAQRKVEVFANETAVILGMGVSGLLHLQLLAARGLRTVIGVTRSPERQTVARSLGATTVVSPVDAAGAVAEATAGSGADLVIEAAGTEGTLGQALSLARPGGTVLAFGVVTAGGVGLPYYDLYFRELRVLSSRSAQAQDYLDGIALVTSGVVAAEEVVTHRLPLSEAPAALAVAGRAPGQLKVSVHMGMAEGSA
ncbi:MAG: zinc-dependent alcohol dehydrogenase [Acidimicrobiales bacterium]